MISKRVARRSKDNFGRLAEYLAAAKEVGEKLDDLWITGSNAGTTKEDLDLAIIEIKATQALNVRVKSDKTYHLIVSFRDERPSPEALRDIEENFAKALGFEEHQRVVATHINTDNFHMHVAYNKIHPISLKSHTPGRDFFKLEQTSRAMETKHNLVVDNGISKEKNIEQASTKSRDYEATTWEQSFDSYVRENKSELKVIFNHSRNWVDIHKGFTNYDLRITKRGNGLVITSKDGKAGIKASAIDRDFSKGVLERKFGPFVPPEKNTNKTNLLKSYRKKPITFHPKQTAAWNRYIGKRRNKDSLAIKVYRNWREFLTAEALNDTLAMAIMVYHKQLLKLPEKAITELKKTSRPCLKS